MLKKGANLSLVGQFEYECVSINIKNPNFGAFLKKGAKKRIRTYIETCYCGI